MIPVSMFGGCSNKSHFEVSGGRHTIVEFCVSVLRFIALKNEAYFIMPNKSKVFDSSHIRLILACY